MCEPSPTILAMYLKRINKTLEDFLPEPEPQLLTEGEIPEDDLLDDDDYEPRYTEEV